MMGNKQMRIALGSLYILDKPISTYDQGTQLLTKSYEILVAMLVGFSEAGRMLFYIIGIRKFSFLQRLEQMSYRMSNDWDASTLTYIMGGVIKSILRAINYYPRESEVIGMIKLAKSGVTDIIKVIKGDILKTIKQSKKNPNTHKKRQKSGLIEIAKNNISKIIKAMSTDGVASVSIKRKRLSLFESYIWCESCNIKQMKWHEVGRIIDIKQWPIEAIRLWAKYQLCLHTFADLATYEAKEDLIEAIQRNNVSKRSTSQPEILWKKSMLELGSDLGDNDTEYCDHYRNNSPEEHVDEPPGEAYVTFGRDQTRA